MWSDRRGGHQVAIDVTRLPEPHQTKMSFPDRRTTDVFLIFVLAVFFAKLHERIAIGLRLASVMVIGITGSLASLGDTIFPIGSLHYALMQDFLASSPCCCACESSTSFLQCRVP